MEHSQRSGDLRVVARSDASSSAWPSATGGGGARAALPGLRRLAVVAAAALLAFAALTAPGKDAAAWVGRLVGIGEVGGSPTQKRHGFEDKGAACRARGDRQRIRRPTGRATSGWPSAARWTCATRGSRTAFAATGFRSTGRPSRAREAGGSCAGPREPGERVPALGSFGVEIVPSQFKGVAKPDMVVSGTVNSPAASRVRIVYSGAHGEKRDLPVDFARVGGPAARARGRGCAAGNLRGLRRGRAGRARPPG